MLHKSLPSIELAPGQPTGLAAVAVVAAVEVVAVEVVAEEEVVVAAAAHLMARASDHENR